MKKFLLACAASFAVLSSQAMIYQCGSFNSSKKTCTLIGWSGSQPSSGKLTIPSTFTHTDGVTYTVTAVAADALNNLTDVTDITVPTSVLVIGNSNNTDKTRAGVENFKNCPNLITFHVASGHTTFSTKNSGILCNQDGSILYRVPAEIAVDTDGQIDINTKVRYITNGSFVDNSSIKILVFPPAVYSISTDAGFNTMKSLAKFTLSSENEDYKVADGALIDIWTMRLLSYPPKRTNQNITISTQVKDISEQAFANTKYLKTIVLPQSVEWILDEAFCNSSVTSVTMPQKLQRLGSKAFYNSSLESMTMWAPTDFDGSANYQFAYCKNLKTLTVNGTNPRFNHGMCKGCTALTKVTCAKTPLEIRGSAFKGCTNLTSFPFSASTEVLGDSIFAETGFTQVVYPSDFPADGIESYMFNTCRQLEKIDLSAVTGTADKRFMTIHPYAISICPKLKEIYFPKYTSFAATANLGTTPNIGPSCPIEKMVIGSFSTSDTQIFLHYGTLLTPSVYIKTTDLTDCFGEWDKLFSGANGGQVHPKLYCEGWEPVSLYHYVVENASYYIPGSCSDNYRKAVDNSKCTVTEMFSLDVANVSGKIKVTVKPKVAGVQMTYVTFNEAIGGAPNANGEVNIGFYFADVTKIRVSYTVNGEKMTTIYPRSQFSGIQEVESEVAAPVVTLNDRQLTVGGLNDGETIEIYTLSGTRLLATHGSSVDLSPILPGTYILRVGSYSQKLLLR